MYRLHPALHIWCWVIIIVINLHKWLHVAIEGTAPQEVVPVEFLGPDFDIEPVGHKAILTTIYYTEGLFP